MVSRAPAQFLRFAFAAFSVLLVLPSSALAVPDNPCGLTVHDAIAVAEKRIASKESDAQALALRCLIRGMKLLDAAQAITTRGADRHPVLHLPSVSGGPGKQ